MVCIKLNAGNDSSGNPRRVFVLFNDDGSINCAMNEGYRGLRALGEYAALFDTTHEFATTVKEYTRILRNYGV